MSVFKVSSNKSSQNQYPSVRPTLDLDFANSKTLDPRITFTRASGGSYVGADGLIKLAGVNEARFDHDPYTGESLGLLVEEARTNLLTYSELFNDAGWTKNNVTVTANAVTGPDGTLTADKLIEGVPSTRKYLRKNVSGANRTYSVYAKAGERNFISIGTSNGGGIWSVAQFNLLTGTYVNAAAVGGPLATSLPLIIPIVDGWYRVSARLADGNQVVIMITNGGDPVFSTYTGDGTSGIYIWGAQLEAGDFPTSYIPTVASTVTRAADLASITGTNFSSWYNQSEGSIMMKAKIQEVQNGTTKQVFIFEGNTSTQRILDTYTFSSNVTYRDFYVDNNGLNTISVSNFTANVFQKFARSYGGNNMSAVTAGIVNGTTSTTIPTTIQQLGIFAGISYGTGFGTLNGTIARLTYYPKRLPDAQLQTLTR